MYTIKKCYITIGLVVISSFFSFGAAYAQSLFTPSPPTPVTVLASTADKTATIVYHFTNRHGIQSFTGTLRFIPRLPDNVVVNPTTTGDVPNCTVAGTGACDLKLNLT